MYPFSTEAQKNLDDLRMNSSQATEPQARVCTLIPITLHLSSVSSNII